MFHFLKIQILDLKILDSTYVQSSKASTLVNYNSQSRIIGNFQVNTILD